MPYRVYQELGGGKSGVSSRRKYALGHPGGTRNWKMDWGWYAMQPNYIQAWREMGGKTQSQLGETISRMLSSGPKHNVGNPNYVYRPDAIARDGGFNERLEIDAIEYMWKHGLPKPAPKPAPAPAVATTAPADPSLEPNKIDVSGGPAPVPGPSGGSDAGGGSVFDSGTGAYQAQGVKSAALNPRRERLKLGSFNRRERPTKLTSLNVA